MAFMTLTAAATHRISLADLDASRSDGTGDKRYVCPLCSPGRSKAKRKDFSVNLATGAWQCWHCKESGKLTDYWTDRPAMTRKGQQRAKLAAAFGLKPTSEPTPATPATDTADVQWRAWLQAAKDIAGTPGADYLGGRGLSVELAHQCGVQYVTRWFGRRPGVLYPLRDQHGVIQAAGVRYTDGRDDPKTRVGGKLSRGVFATPGALDADPVIVVEGPADALAIASTGRSAVALHRTSAPDWLVKKLAFRRVSVGLDADTSGDAASDTLAGELRAYGAVVTRLRPPAPKDWNDTLVAWGVERLTDWLTATLSPAPAPRVQPSVCPGCDAVGENHISAWAPGRCPDCGGPGSPRADGRCYGCLGYGRAFWEGITGTGGAVRGRGRDVAEGEPYPGVGA